MNKYVPPHRPQQTYSQGYWHAVIAAVLYLLSSMALMINMLGYFLGHYPQHFELSDEQRNLILQTMMFFVWLAGGAGVFTRLDSGWQYVDALYFCDVSMIAPSAPVTALKHAAGYHFDRRLRRLPSH